VSYLPRISAERRLEGIVFLFAVNDYGETGESGHGKRKKEGFEAKE
jgi:hypothetical protein